jgi:hypothetical protein
MRLLTTQDGLPRVSWGAVLAGVILSLIVYLILTILGTADGASVLSPMAQPNPARGFAFASGAYMIIMTVVAVFVGSIRRKLRPGNGRSSANGYTPRDTLKSPNALISIADLPVNEMP